MADVATSPPGTRATLTGPRRRPPWTTARARLHPVRRRTAPHRTASGAPSVPDRPHGHRPLSTRSTATTCAWTGRPAVPQTAPGRARPVRRPRPPPVPLRPGLRRRTAHPRARVGRHSRARTLTGDARERRPTDGRAAATAPWNVMPRQVRFPRREFVPDTAARPTTDARDGYRAGRLPDRPGPDGPRRSPLHGRLLRHRGRLARAAARPMPRDVSRHAPITAHDAPSPTKARKFTVRHIIPGSVGKA